jgi:hypothetical protein
MKIRTRTAAARLAAALLVSAAFPLAAADVIGKISYLAGKVEIVRDEGPLDAKTVKAGLSLENFDLLKTGADGEIEVQVTSPSAPSSTIRVGPRTQFSIEIGKVGTKQRTTFDLIAGSLAMKVARLTGNQEMQVQTEAAVVGVRGTDFTVTAPATGDLLITCDDGEVECTDEKGTTLQAAAGEAIEQQWGKRIAKLAAALDEWQDRQNADLESDPLKYVGKFAWIYGVRKNQFERRYLALTKSPGRTVGDLIRVWITYRKLVRLHARLFELEEFCEERGITGKIGLFRTSTSFFAGYKRDRMNLEVRMVNVRREVRQYMLRNGGILFWIIERNKK